MAVGEKERNLEVQDECAYMYVYGKEKDIWAERERGGGTRSCDSG